MVLLNWLRLKAREVPPMSQNRLMSAASDCDQTLQKAMESIGRELRQNAGKNPVPVLVEFERTGVQLKSKEKTKRVNMPP